MDYTHIDVEVRDRVGWLWLDRPDKRNALSPDMWEDLPAAVATLAENEEVRSLVVAGRGQAFTVGIDLAMLVELAPKGRSETETRQLVYRQIRQLQTSMSALADCSKPVVAAIHGYCLGAGIDLITACDIRLAAADAVFSIRETRMALVADVGTLQRLPGIVGAGHVAELAFTGRDIDAGRAREIGLVNDVYPDVDLLHEAAGELAAEIAANSPLAVEGTKSVLRAGADMSIEQALDHVALWNAAFLHSNDLSEAVAAFADKRPPEFTGT